MEETNCIMVKDGTICTHLDEGLGASTALSNLPEQCAFNYKYMLKLETIMDKIDLTMYPQPCIFYGENLRGAIVGMKY